MHRKTPKVGDRVVVDWEGYTIGNNNIIVCISTSTRLILICVLLILLVGYYGRPFQTRNKVILGYTFDIRCRKLLMYGFGCVLFLGERRSI